MSVSRDRIGSIPQSTGVYILKDAKGRSMYVGKAKNLRARIRSYFAKGEDAQRPQIRYLMNIGLHAATMVPGSFFNGNEQVRSNPWAFFTTYTWYGF